MLVKNRIPGSLDYVTAFEAGGRGYTLTLTVRQDAFERYRSIAEQVAASVAFSGGRYQPADPLPGDLEVPHKQVVTIHARAEDQSAARSAARALDGYERAWSRVGIAERKRAGPLHLVLTAPDSFAETSHRFGSAPAAYDPILCAVVAIPPPSDQEAFDLWRGRLFGALAEAALHRDLTCEAPAWLRSGLASCMEAAGRSGKKTDAAHPTYLTRIQLKLSGDMHLSLPELERLTRADFETAETLDAATHAWAYAHLLLHGRSVLSSHFKKWVKALVKAPAGDAPPFERKKYAKERADLEKHVERTWGK